MRNRLKLLVVAGPTGVGKTAAAVALARRLAIEVISADSRQVYRGMDTATGKPTEAERAAVAHHLIDIVDPAGRYHAARFRVDAAAAIEAIAGRGRLPVIVGGTGLYIRALLRGLDPAPPADLEFRRRLAGVAAAEGRGVLHAQLSVEAPEVARRLHPNDHVRVIRALERVRAGGAAGAGPTGWEGRDPRYDVRYVGLTVDRAVLAARLRDRAARMVEAGLEDEVRRLLVAGYAPSLPALSSIGYKQFVTVVLEGRGREEALSEMQRDTVQYARRQWTWFAREPELRWIDASAGADAVAAKLQACIENGRH